MNIDDLKIGEARELARMFGGGTKGATTVERKRVVCVIDRGWIFAGDQSVTSDGYIRLDNAVHVFRWESIGFAKMLKEWKSSSVDLRPCEAVEVPQDAVIFRIPVEDGWGKK